MRDEAVRNAQGELIGIDVKLKHRTLVGMRPFKHLWPGTLVFEVWKRVIPDLRDVRSR
ncbi:MAG: hypothetical protein ACLPID_08190 [Beijerinckiaceae bacterium]